MKRAIPRSLLAGMAESRNARDADRTEEEDSRAGGQGGAWKAGAVAQVEGDLAAAREAVVADILAGRRELSLDPAQIEDPMGSDRHEGWAGTASFEALRDSIAANGQDVPVQVWPADPDWSPDPREPFDMAGVRFIVLSGRRRRAACAALELPIRAVIVPRGAGGSEAKRRFDMLFHRFRENEAREDLSPFERLVSIGEIYEALATAEEGAPTAVAFAGRIGVHESIVSRARAVWRHREEIARRTAEPWTLTFKALQTLLSEIEGGKPKAKPARKPPTVSARVEQGGRVVTATLDDKGRLTISAPGVALDKDSLGKALAKIAAALPAKTAKKRNVQMPD